LFLKRIKSLSHHGPIIFYVRRTAYNEAVPKVEEEEEKEEKKEKK